MSTNLFIRPGVGPQLPRFVSFTSEFPARSWQHLDKLFKLTDILNEVSYQSELQETVLDIVLLQRLAELILLEGYRNISSLCP